MSLGSDASSGSGSGSDASSYSSEEEEEQVRPPPKKPAANSLAPPKPSTAASEAQTPKSKPPANPFAPNSSSSEEEEEDDDDKEEGSGNEESQSDSDTDEKATKTQPPPPPKPTATAAAATKPADSDSTTDGSDSESSDQPAPPRHSLRVAEPTIQPLSSKPMDDTLVKDSDKKKKAKALEPVASEEGSFQRRQLFQRIWSEDDEMAVLRGLVDYHAKKGIVPSSSTEMEAFHNFVHKSLTANISKAQLLHKVRNLKKKHENFAKRRGEPKPRDKAAWELSTQIWGNVGKVKVESSREKTIKNEPSMVSSEDEEEEGDLAEEGKDSPSYPMLRKVICGSKKRRAFVAEETMHMLDHLKASALERKYKKLAMQEMKMDERRMELLKDSIKLFRDALANSG